MNNIDFDNQIVNWKNNSDVVVYWSNNSSEIVEWSSSAASNNIRYADFVRVTTPTATYRFTTAPSDQTITAVDATAFSAVGVLIKVGEAQRDIKSTANETSVTLTGIDTATLGWVLGQNVKGSQIEMWHGFYNTANELITTGGVGGLYQFFNGYISTFSISEQWMEEIRMYVGTITVSASSIQLILQNRTAGRYTNNNSWQFFNAGDTSMNRVNFIQSINYQFGKGANANS
jgi:hypothetical protein